MTSGSNQHYVPQFLLRPFGEGPKKGRTIYRFDKVSQATEKLKIKDVASSADLYNFRNGQGSVDPFLRDIEDSAAPVIRKLLSTKNVIRLRTYERQAVSRCICAQLYRAEASFKDQFSQAGKVAKIFSGQNIDNKFVDFFTDPNAIHDSQLEKIRNSVEKFSPILVDKSWYLARSTSNVPFYISDNPAALYNPVPPQPFRSNLGLLCIGIHIVLPISPALMLLMVCKKFSDRLIDNVYCFAEAAAEGCPLPFVRNDVEMFNHLQVMRSERYLFSCRPNFDFVSKILSENPSAVNGPRTLVVHPSGDKYPQRMLGTTRCQSL